MMDVSKTSKMKTLAEGKWSKYEGGIDRVNQMERRQVKKKEYKWTVSATWSEMGSRLAQKCMPSHPIENKKTVSKQKDRIENKKIVSKPQEVVGTDYGSSISAKVFGVLSPHP